MAKLGREFRVGAISVAPVGDAGLSQGPIEGASTRWIQHAGNAPNLIHISSSFHPSSCILFGWQIPAHEIYFVCGSFKKPTFIIERVKILPLDHTLLSALFETSKKDHLIFLVVHCFQGVMAQVCHLGERNY